MMRKIFFICFILFSCSSGEKNEFSSVYTNKTSEILLTIDKKNLTPADSTVLKATSKNLTDIIDVKLLYKENFPYLKLISKNKINNIYVFEFDSALPNKYYFPDMEFTMSDNSKIFAENIFLNVYSVAENSEELKNLKPNFKNIFRPIYYIYIFTAIAVIIFFTIVVFYILKMKKNRKNKISELDLLKKKLSKLREDIVANFAEEKSTDFSFKLFSLLEGLKKYFQFDEAIQSIKNSLEVAIFAGGKIEKMELLEYIAIIFKLIATDKKENM